MNNEQTTAIPERAISLYNSDTHEEFPVLRAFQQYIDAEQEKARKRMLSLSIFFGCLITILVAFFLFMLNSVSSRNQALNDRLIEYAIKDRDRQASVVVQQPQQDNSALLALTARLDEMQKKLLEAQQQAVEAEKARTEAAQQAAEKAAKDREAIALAMEKKKTQEALEVERLKALLAAEREKAAAERERKREAELEEYRRKHYPEYYAKKENPEPSKAITIEEVDATEEPDPIDELLDELSDEGAINYFEEEEEASSTSKVKSYAMPVEVKGNRNKWRIPND